MVAGDLAASGAPSNLGKVNADSGMFCPAISCPWLTSGVALADADPLGTKQNVTFDQVGGLDEREILVLSGRSG